MPAPRYAAGVRKLAKTSIRLADGRELLYYDEREGIDRRVPDTRDLAAAVTSSQIRRDPLLEEWVIIASHRQGRTHLPPADQCPLCPSTDGRATEIPAADYDVVVFENRFPSLAPDPPDSPGDHPGGPPDPPGPVPDGGPFRRRPGVGRCEVVCFTSDHDGALARLPVERIRTVVEVWADRTLELGALEGVEQVFPFENRGEEIGVTLHHPHGQIYAYPFVAPRTARQLDVARAHRDATGGCRSCSIVEAEADGERVVARAPGWLAFVPFAARWPFEVHLFPTRHLPDLPALEDDERDGLAALLKDLLGRFDALFDQPLPYMLTCHQAPVRRDRDLAHVHLEAFSIRRTAAKLKYLASSESGAGVFINDIAPEQAAELLRSATPGGR
jgi:UDPglucose--hexose-1-phosphate uridylyltransferase